MKNKIVSTCIILNRKNEILLQKKTLDYPFNDKGQWHLFGGSLKKCENPEQAIKRELLEEITLKLDHFKLFKIQRCSDFTKEYCFIHQLKENLQNISLKEGAGFAFLDSSELNSFNIFEPHLKIIKEYFEEVNNVKQ